MQLQLAAAAREYTPPPPPPPLTLRRASCDLWHWHAPRGCTAGMTQAARRRHVTAVPPNQALCFGGLPNAALATATPTRSQMIVSGCPGSRCTCIRLQAAFGRTGGPMLTKGQQAGATAQRRSAGGPQQPPRCRAGRFGAARPGTGTAASCQRRMSAHSTP